MRCRKKIGQKKITEANFSNLVSDLLYTYLKKSTEKLWAKSILCAKLDMRILQRLALNTHVQIFYWSLRPSECMPWILLLCIFGDFYASGMQDAEVNKVTAYFFCTDKSLFKDLVFERNHWKYWMSFIAWDCHFSRSYTVHSWFSKGCSYWAYQTMQWFPWVTTKQ